VSTTILLIRHGETRWNRQKVFRGTFNVALNENGRRQACLTADALKPCRIDVGYSSPLSRAVETARIVLAAHGVEPVVHDGLLDFDYGQWTGKADSEVARLWPSEHALWGSQPHRVRVPGGNTLREVSERAFVAVEQICAQHDGKTVALFSHRVVNKLLIIACMGLGLDRFGFIVQGNCCINRLERTAGGYVIQTLNETSHIRSGGGELLDFDF